MMSISQTTRRICLRLAKLLLVIAATIGIVIWTIERSKTTLSSVATTDEIEEGSLETKRRPTLEFSRCRLSTENQTNQDQDDLSYCFKILQIADIHLGEAENLDWGPEQDRKTWIVLDSVIKREQPDLIILSGDQLTANNCKENATAYYQILGEFLSNYNTPWATIFGNHDDLGFVDPETGKQSPEAKYNRRDLMKVDQSFPLSLSQAGPKTVFGTSNYVLDILMNRNDDASRDEEDTNRSLATQVFLFDSGGGSLPEVIDETHLQWFNQVNQDATIPAVAFQHIPTLNHEYSQRRCSGMDGDNGMAPLESDAGIVPALVQAKRFLFLAVGHNHGNDYCCPYAATADNTTSYDEEYTPEKAFYLCFGRHSGYGGYGKWERGARVYELKLNQAQMSWESWVRLESGDIIDNV